MATGRNDYDLPVVPGTGGIIGDVVSDIQTVGAGAYLTYQPAVGVECLITAVGCSASDGTAPQGYVKVETALYNGSSRIFIHQEGSVGQQGSRLQVFINNSVYLQVRNADTSTTRNVGYCGYTLI